MKAAYGIFTTDGDAVAGTLHDEYARRLAEQLDESTVSLYISTKNGVFLLGTTINVQRKGRRPDTLIYLEKLGWNHEPLPEIDLAFIHEFYRRMVARLSESEYVVRDPALDDDFFTKRRNRGITDLMSADMVDYSVGRLLLGKEVVCVSGDRAKSVDFVVAVTERLHPFLSPGFTIVVAQRAFRDADMLVTEKYSGTVHVALATEETADSKWGDTYRNLGVFARNPIIRQKISTERTRQSLAAGLISEYKHHIHAQRGKAALFETFLSEETVDALRVPTRQFSPAAYEPPEKGKETPPNESDYESGNREDSERERLERGYEEQMRKKKKARVRFLVALGLVFFILAAGAVLFVLYPEYLPVGGNAPDVPVITPSATIVPENETSLVTRLNTTPGNIPEGLEGFGSAYEIVVSGPQNVTIAVTAEFQQDASYSLMKYNESGFAWEPVFTPVLVLNQSAGVLIPDSGIYRLFTGKESRLNASVEAGSVSG